MAARRGDTLLFPTPPIVAAHAAIGGKKEGEGPLAACFDALSADNFFGQSSWEAAEKELALQTARLCLKKAQTTPEKVSLVLAGPAARWPKRWASARRCAAPGWPTACWP